MESHEKEEHEDKKHIGKIIKKAWNTTGAYYSRYSQLLDDTSKKIIQVKNSTVKLCKKRINWSRYPYTIEEWWQENHAAY